jgi:rhomboid family GlyGly-CTERM serine protease
LQLISLLRTCWQPLLIASICLVLQIWGDPHWLRYQRMPVLDGELWRFFTANFIHLGWSHWALNMTGLALVFILVGKQFTAWQWLVVSLGSALGVSLGLFVLNPQLSWYVGFSGVLHGLLVAGTLADIVHHRGHQRGFGVLLLACVVGKLAWEQSVGSLPGSAAIAGAPVVVDAHLYGAVAGFVCGGIVLLVQWALAEKLRTR